MGNSESAINEDQSADQVDQQIDKSYELVSRQNDPCYGQIQVLKHKITQELICLKSKNFHNSDDFDDYLAEIKHLREFQHHALLTFLDLKEVAEDEFCGSFYKISQILEYYPRSLQTIKPLEEINEKVLLQGLSGLLECLSYLHVNGIQHQNLTPQQIFVSENCKLKIGIPQLLNEQTHYQQVMLNLTSNLYMSPELFTCLNCNQLRQDEISLEKCDVFSLGLIFLEIFSGQNAQEIYDFEIGFIREQIVNQMLSQVEKIYGQGLVQVLGGFLQVEDVRYTFQQAQQVVDLFLKTFEGLKQKSEVESQSIEEVEVIKRHGKKHVAQKEEYSENKFNQLEEELNQIPLTKQQPDYEEESVLKENQIQDIQLKASNSSKQVIDFQLKPEPLQEQMKYANSLKEIDQLISQAVEQSNKTKKKYENSIELRQFLKQMLHDEVFVPIQPSPQKKQANKLKNMAKSKR